MEKIETKLFLNYFRPNGQPWNRDVNRGFQSSLPTTGYIRVYPEVLVPSSAGSTGINLTSLANTIYLAAREKNMSLSSYGHLDPVKFVIASTFVALLIEELRRDLSIPSKFEFGNRAYGTALMKAFNGTSDTVGSVLTNLSGYVARLNMCISRCNALYIPAIHILEEWLPHRTMIYKDDEGERYQFYGYKMANYYELDVSSSSATVGQLLFTDLAFGRTIAQKFELIERLLSQYEGDDDFVNFAAESIKAGLSRIILQPAILSNDAKIMLPQLREEFSVDDLFSLENAYYISPITSSTHTPFLSSKHTWDIMENVSTGKFEVGKYNNIADRLPVLHPIIALGYTGDATNNSDCINNRPIFSHAKIESEDGIKYLTKYMASVSDAAINSSSQCLVCTGYTSTSKTFNNASITYLSAHSSTILCSPIVINSITLGVQTFFDKIQGCYISDVCYTTRDILNYIMGFKGVSYLYVLADDFTDAADFFHDFDYISSISEENLNQYFASRLWNNFIMINGSSRTDGGYRGNKRKGKKAPKPQDKPTPEEGK